MLMYIIILVNVERYNINNINITPMFPKRRFPPKRGKKWGGTDVCSLIHEITESLFPLDP